MKNKKPGIFKVPYLISSKLRAAPDDYLTGQQSVVDRGFPNNPPRALSSPEMRAPFLILSLYLLGKTFEPI